METAFDSRPQGGEDNIRLLPASYRSDSEPPGKRDEHLWPRIGRSPFLRSKLLSIGIWNIFLLSAGFLISSAITTFLGFLWFSSPDCDARSSSCRLWRGIVLSNGAISTVVTISAAVLRTTLSLQASVALSMVAALALESAAGVPLRFVPLVLTLRGFGASAYQLLTYLWATFRSAPLCNICALVVIMATLASQLTSTLLISSLGPGSVVGDPVSADVYIGKAISVEQDSIDFDDHPPQYWFGGIREYPIFAEATISVPPNHEIWKRDTGTTLRAFPPVRSSDERRLLESFDGYSPVWDTRFSCMPVDIEGFITKDTKPFPNRIYPGGRLSVTLPSHMSVQPSSITGDQDGQVLKISRFNCSLAFDPLRNPEREWTITICAVRDPSSQRNVRMESPLIGPDDLMANVIPRQYLVINTTGESQYWMSTSPADLNWEFAKQDAWTTASVPINYNMVFQNRTYQKNTTLSLAISYCATSLASSVVPVHMKRGRGKAELVAELANQHQSHNWSNSDEIARLYTGALDGDSRFARGVLELEPRAAGGGWTAQKLPDLLIPYELASVKIEFTHEGALLQGNGVDVSIGLCSRCPLDILSSFRAHKHHAALFQHILQSTSSLPLAMQTLWTVLAQMAFYDNFPEFDVHREAAIVSYRQVLIPVRVNGLVFVVIIIIMQNLAVVLIIALFLRRTRLSLVGNLWQGFGQLVTSDIGGIASRTTVATDKEVLAHLEKEGVDGTPITLLYDARGKSSRLVQMDRGQPSARLRTLNQPEVI